MVVSENLEQSRAALTMIQPEPFNAEACIEGVRAEITPTEFHYVRSNFRLPAHDGVLEIAGAVENPTTLTLDDLRAMPAVERVVTLECAGNGRLRQTPLPAGEPWGRLAVSTARWRGAFLYQVLEQARPATNGVEVKFEGADHGRYQQYGDLTFVRSLALEHATDAVAEILIAYEMNGEPLNADHGKPFRLIVPHWYGVASVKWLKRIEVTTEPFQGEFEARHYMYEWADFIGAPGALPRAAGPRLGPPGPLGTRTPTRPSEGRRCPARHHQVGGRPHGPSGPRPGHAGRLEALLRRDAPAGPGAPRRPLGALGIRAGGPPGRRGTKGPRKGEGAPRLAGSPPGQASRGSRACPGGSRTRTGGSCEASPPTGGQRCAAARTVRRADN